MNDGFEMPKEVPTRVPGFDTPRSPAAYAPKTRGETKVLEGLERELSRPHVPDGVIAEIQGLIKKLTHRQMQQLCNQIYKDDKAIDRIAMPEVLDHFAHGD